MRQLYLSSVPNMHKARVERKWDDERRERCEGVWYGREACVGGNRGEEGCGEVQKWVQDLPPPECDCADGALAGNMNLAHNIDGPGTKVRDKDC